MNTTRTKWTLPNDNDVDVNDDVGMRIGDAVIDATDDVTESMATLSCSEKESKADRKVKKGTPCSCGSGLKSRKCCLSKKEKRTVGRSSKNKKGVQLPDNSGRLEDANIQNDEQSKTGGQFQVVSI
jgi:hypothetical protein